MRNRLVRAYRVYLGSDGCAYVSISTSDLQEEGSVTLRASGCAGLREARRGGTTKQCGKSKMTSPLLTMAQNSGVMSGSTAKKGTVAPPKKEGL